MEWGKRGMVKSVHRNLLICLILILFPLSAFADYLDQMEQLYRSGASSQAYELGRSHLFQGEGDPRFDLYYGLAAVDSGSTSEGIFALERLLQVEPNNYPAHLGLARAYLRLGHKSRAREELQKIVAGTPSPEVLKEAQGELDRLEGRAGGNKPTGRVYLEIGAGYDSNINGGVTDDGLIPILTPDSEAREDGYYSVAGGAFGSVPLIGGLSLFGVVEGLKRENFDNSDFDIDQLDASGGFAFRVGRHTFQLAALWQDYDVGHDPYRTTFGVRGEWRREMQGGGRVSLYLETDALDYDDNITNELDSRLGTVGLGWSAPFAESSDSRYFVTFYGGAEREREDSFGPVLGLTVPDRQLYGLRLGADIEAGYDVRFDLTAQTQWSDYNEDTLDSSFTLRSRNDNYYYVGAGATWQFQKNWKLRGSVSYTNNNSSIDLYDYDRTQAGVTLRFEY
jgi:hypothetical protein